MSSNGTFKDGFSFLNKDNALLQVIRVFVLVFKVICTPKKLYRTVKKQIMKRTSRIILAVILVVTISACSVPAQPTTTKASMAESPTVTIPEELPAITETAPSPTAVVALIDYQNLTYQIEGTPVTLKNGISEVETAPGSATKIVTKIFGNEAFGDLNGDGKEDVAFLITQDGGGSGNFFYAAAALQTESGSVGTNVVFLGDRIAPQNTVIEAGQIEVNYADRKPDEPMSAQPSIEVSKYFKVVDQKLVEVSILP